MADGRPPHATTPLRRAAANLASRFGNGFLDRSQPLLLIDPPGYGAARVLDDFVGMCARGECRLPGFKVGVVAERADAIDDLSSLLLEIAAIASAGPDDLPSWRLRLNAWRRDRGAAGFRHDLDRYLADALGRISGVVLCVPRIDRILDGLSGMTPREDWQLRGYINAHPIRLVATAPAGWRAKGNDAFFQTFWPIRPELCRDDDLDVMAARLRLGKEARAVLAELSHRLGGRPQLVERAAGILAFERKASAESVLGELARTPPAALVEQLGSASRQALRILAHTASLALPADAGTIARAANVGASLVSTQMGRLAEIGLVTVVRDASRDHRYDFADPVARCLYAAMVNASGPPVPEMPAVNVG